METTLEKSLQNGISSEFVQFLVSAAQGCPGHICYCRLLHLPGKPIICMTEDEIYLMRLTHSNIMDA